MTQSLLVDFCVRLSCGLACMMVCTPGRAAGAQFFRTLNLVVLALSVLAVLAGSTTWQVPGILLLGSAGLAFIGFVVWTLRRVVAAQRVAMLLLGTTAAALLLPQWSRTAPGLTEHLIASGDAMTSALVLGSTLAAMLLGHSYLVTPTMSIDPLKRLVLWIGGSLVGRAGFAGLTLLLNVDSTPRALARPFDEFWWMMLAARWLIGLVGPGVLTCMVWQTARIRSTQAATGILYAGVILTFFGELVGQFLMVRNVS